MYIGSDSEKPAAAKPEEKSTPPPKPKPAAKTEEKTVNFLHLRREYLTKSLKSLVIKLKSLCKRR